MTHTTFQLRKTSHISTLDATFKANNVYHSMTHTTFQLRKTSHISTLDATFKANNVYHSMTHTTFQLHKTSHINTLDATFKANNVYYNMTHTTFQLHKTSHISNLDATFKAHKQCVLQYGIWYTLHCNNVLIEKSPYELCEKATNRRQHTATHCNTSKHQVYCEYYLNYVKRLQIVEKSIWTMWKKPTNRWSKGYKSLINNL